AGAVRQLASDETVRVQNFQETQRADESVIYQQFIGVPPGIYKVMVTVRDRSGPAASHQDRTDTVPRFAGQGTSAPLAVYRGTGRFESGQVGSAATHTAPFLVSFSDQWAITNYDQMIGLLRYFERQDWVDKLRHATPDQRPAVWQQFYKATDPVDLTPENEAL